ncbi:hypothetical protein FQZ97_1062010 [compost metagenome]
MHGGDLDARVLAGHLFVQFLDAEHVRKGLQALHAGVFERVGSLDAQRGAIHQEQDAAKPFGFEQAVDQRDTGFRFACSGGHGQQDLALALADPALGFLDGGLLIVAQREAVVEGCLSELLVCARFISTEQRL